MKWFTNISNIYLKPWKIFINFFFIITYFPNLIFFSLTGSKETFNNKKKNEKTKWNHIWQIIVTIRIKLFYSIWRIYIRKYSLSLPR